MSLAYANMSQVAIFDFLRFNWRHLTSVDGGDRRACFFCGEVTVVFCESVRGVVELSFLDRFLNALVRDLLRLSFFTSWL